MSEDGGPAFPSPVDETPESLETRARILECYIASSSIDEGRRLTAEIAQLREKAKINQRTPGMSLRDYFAGQAMSAIIASDFLMTTASGLPGDLEDTIAKIAYETADAMLRAREKT